MFYSTNVICARTASGNVRKRSENGVRFTS